MPSQADQFALVVDQAFGPEWRVVRRPDGFEAILDLRDDPSTTPDDFTIDVTVDDAAGTFTMTSARTRESSTDVERKSLGRYQRNIDKRSYSGAHRTWTFKRTPGGLVPSPNDPRNTGAREQEVVALGKSLGLTPTGSTGASMDLSAMATPRVKRILVILAVAFGLAILVAVGVVIAVVSSIAGVLAG